MPKKVYRGRYEIISQILSIINNGSPTGIPRTSIMFTAFLSHAQLKEYLSFLQQKGLIDESPMQIQNTVGKERYVYKITEKGVRLLQISKEIESIVGLD
jgi:predicted transcriptional regulator